MSKPSLHYGEIYITNVCNYNCQDCNRFNNYYFSGQYKWDEWKDVYTEWGDKIDFETMSIIGGEPLLNPDVNDWIDGIATIWPNTALRVITNGSTLNKTRGLYDTLLKHEGRVSLEISLHDNTRFSEFYNELYKFLGPNPAVNYESFDGMNEIWKDEYNKIRASHWPDCDTPAEYINLPGLIRVELEKIHNFHNNNNEFFNQHCIKNVVDDNNIKAQVRNGWYFHKSPLTENNGSFTVLDSDPDKAIDVCYAKKCHHFVKGKLHKCGVVSLLPEFYKQFNFDISDEDTALMHSYKPLTLTSTIAETNDFIDNLSNNKVIPQCKFCSEDLEHRIFKASTDKVRIPKKHD